MLRGINRQVLEITETNNMYYEKALLVVRPEYTDAQKNVLEREAKLMLRRMYPPSAIKIKSDRKSTRLNSSHIPLSRMPSSA